MFGDVLVPLDGSELSARALVPGAAVARANESPLRVVSYTSAWNHEQLLVAVERQCSTLDVPNLSVSVEPAGPGVIERLTELVEARPSSLVVMSTIGRGSTGALLGSVAEGVLERTFGPAILVGPECVTESFDVGGTILVALDGSSYAESILSVAEAWAIGLSYDIEIVSVLDPGQVMAATTSGRAPPGAIETGYVHNRARDAAEVIGRDVQFDVLHDSNPARALVEHAASQHSDMIAVATHGRSGLARLVMGSVSMHVVHRAPCPVLAIRPPDLG